jgi:hypothetical protein
MISKLDDESCKTLQKDVIAALAEVMKKHGVAVHAAGGQMYGDSRAVLKFEFTVASPEFAEAAAKKDFAFEAPLAGIKPEAFGYQFRTIHGLYTVCGVKASRPKLPLIGKTPAGKLFKFPANVLPAHLREDWA